MAWCSGGVQGRDNVTDKISHPYIWDRIYSFV